LRNYFDYNATAPLREVAHQSMIKSMRLLGNASSIHSFGREVRKEIESSRKMVAHVLGVEAKRIIFTSGATESNNLALKNFPGRVIISSIEHDSVFKVRDDAIILPVLANGVVDLESLEGLLSKERERPTLVSVMAANNETGVIQPLTDVIHICKKYGAYVHSDAVQAVGKVKFPWHELDMVSISGHKVGGPAGIGCLIINPQLAVAPQMKGGGQERSYRAGTENLIGIVGMAAALNESLQDDWGNVGKLRDKLEDLIFEDTPDALILDDNVARLKNTTVLHMAGVRSEVQIMSFDLKGFAVSAGSACSSGKVKASRVLKAMGFNADKINKTIRVSLGPQSTFTEIYEFAKIWKSIYQKCSSVENRDVNNVLGDDYESAYGA
jgi:cysteine desulfurase